MLTYMKKNKKNPKKNPPAIIRGRKKNIMFLQNRSFLLKSHLKMNSTLTHAVHSRHPHSYMCTVDTSGSHQISSSCVTRTNGCVF